MADFEIERPSVDVSPINPVYNVNQPHFTIEIHGSTQGLKGEKGDPGQDGRDGIDGTNGIDGADGVSVVSIEQTTTSSVSGGTNIVTATLSNGDVSTFEILNGEKGDGAKSFEYGDISDITSTSDDIYQDLASCVENQLPFVITDGDETYQALYSYKYSDYIKIYYLSSQDIVNTIELQGSPTVTVTESTYGIQEKITNNNLLDYSLIDNTPTIPSDTSDLTNGAGFITSSTVSDALEFASWFNFVDSDSNNCKVVYDGNRIGDSDMAYVGTNAIMHNDSGTFVSLDEVIDGKQNVIDNNNKLDYSYISNTPTIPDELSDLSDDSTHRLVTDTEKTTWSGKQDALVSGTNIKTVNNNSLLGSGDVSVQETLVSGTNIKTINNNSLLGSGNITISGGGSSTDVQINGTSIVVSDVANILTETAYDSSTNKIATMSDLPTVPTNISSFNNDSGYITGISSGDVTTALGFTPYDASNPSGYISSYTETDPIFTGSAAYGISSSDITNWNNKSTFSGSYNDLTDKPTIPTVNNATLTIQKNGTTVKTFTANASSNVTADITVPTKTSDLNNDSGFVTTNNDIQINGTSIVSSNVANIITETAYNSATNKIATMSDIAGNIYEINDILAITSTSDANFVSLIDDIENNNPFLISYSYLGITETIKPTSEADMNGIYSIRFMNSFEYDGDGYTDFYETIQLEVSGSTVTVTDTKTPSLNHIGESKVNGTFVTDIITNTAYNSSSNKIATMSDVPTITLSTTTWIDSLF